MDFRGNVLTGSGMAETGKDGRDGRDRAEMSEEKRKETKKKLNLKCVPVYDYGALFLIEFIW